MNKLLKARSSLLSPETYFTFFSRFLLLPGKERSLAGFDSVVERLLIGDRPVTGRLIDHLVLPLTGLNVH